MKPIKVKLKLPTDMEVIIDKINELVDVVNGLKKGLSKILPNE